MKIAHPLSVLAVAVSLAACGGGSDTTPNDAARLLIDQGSECFAVAAGRAAPDRFNATAADIASVPQAAACMAWPAGLSIPCADAYALYSRPFGGKCL